jgi:hypothetical protein
MENSMELEADISPLFEMQIDHAEFTSKVHYEYGKNEPDPISNLGLSELLADIDTVLASIVLPGDPAASNRNNTSIVPRGPLISAESGNSQLIEILDDTELELLSHHGTQYSAHLVAKRRAKRYGVFVIKTDKSKKALYSTKPER